MSRLWEALEYYDLAISKDHNNADYYNNKASVLHELNRLDEALKCYD